MGRTRAKNIDRQAVYSLRYSVFADAMKVALAQVPPTGFTVDFTAPPEVLEDAGEGTCVREPVTVRGRAERSAGGLRIGGVVAASLTLTCSRCLTGFLHRLERRFDVTYAPMVVAGEEVELEGRDLEVCHLEDGETVDLTELAHEQVLLALPMAPVCDDGCKGLCMVCGANRNGEGCTCPQAVDPRFAALKKIL